MEITQRKYEFFVYQKKYAKEILTKFKIENCKEISIPINQKEKLSKDDGAEKVDQTYFRSFIGCLMYPTTTRPDILYVVSVLSRFMHCPSEVHFPAAKRVVRYFKGTITYGVKFQKSQPVKLCGYSDSDWGGFEGDAKSTSGYYFSFGSGIFSWSCKKQDIVAQSTAEAEFVAAATKVNQALWLKKILVDLHMEPTGSMKVFVDNEAVIAISHNLVFHGRTKNIKIKLFFLRDVQKYEDIFTKPLPIIKFHLFLREVQKDGDITLFYCKMEEHLDDILLSLYQSASFSFSGRKLEFAVSKHGGLDAARAAAPPQDKWPPERDRPDKM
ncbi:uncharacterized mitochondrial protein AtMg00810-like [Solanum tuberosum]|uniref:uncharacterized mitochondrial protein AtMg00810-like n=1 Tax=Solanum tuberosum TaxID=4113 RepID=UPI00073A1118|nr:PREDICTED: uncharacterized mitochondrial protein AtMg00810-like [Solanum tuberosum]